MGYLQTHVHIYLVAIKSVIILERIVSHGSILSAKEKENYFTKLKRHMIEMLMEKTDQIYAVLVNCIKRTSQGA